MTIPLLALNACILATPLAAQWLNQPTAGIPRTADGRPNLAAPAPRTADGRPDLSGLWRRNTKYALNAAPDLKPPEIAPWAQALVVQRSEDLMKDHMSVLCLPNGPGYATSGDLSRIIQTPSLIAMLHPDLTYRQIFLDGRALEKDPNPTWMGYSVGRWEEDTLVVESAGFNDRTWLDGQGHPHTEGLRTTERYRRLSLGRMELMLTFADPKVYAKPWTITIDMSLATDTEMIEYVCNENEKDRVHMVGKASDDQKNAVTLAPEVLAKYAGNYQMGPQVVAVVVEHGELKFNFRGIVLTLIPFSETAFSSPLLGRLDFKKGTDGAVTQFTLQAVGGDSTGVRIK